MPDNIDDWYARMVQLGQDNVPMLIDGRETTPRAYMRSLGR